MKNSTVPGYGTDEIQDYVLYLLRRGPENIFFLIDAVTTHFGCDGNRHGAAVTRDALDHLRRTNEIKRVESWTSGPQFALTKET